LLPDIQDALPATSSHLCGLATAQVNFYLYQSSQHLPSPSSSLCQIITSLGFLISLQLTLCGPTGKSWLFLYLNYIKHWEYPSEISPPTKKLTVGWNIEIKQVEVPYFYLFRDLC
jgi:hypothetical protein